MSESRDPFPMQSEEARRLAGNTNEATQWNRMGTSIETSSAVKAATATVTGLETEEDDVDTLVLSKKMKKQGKTDDIYEHVDQLTSSPSSKKKIIDTDDYIDRDVAGIEKNHEREEKIRTLCLSATLFFTIGGYWLLRSLKDPVITALCGVSAIPKAKMLSVVVVLLVVSVYNVLLDHPKLTKHSLFYVFGMFYFVAFSTISFLLTHPTIGLPNQQPSFHRILGWVSYCTIESFGSVMVTLFWSFANSNFDLESAKANYGLLVSAAQVGSILGPTVVKTYAETWGVAQCYFMGALCMLLIQVTMWIYITRYGTEETRAAAEAADIANNEQPKQEDEKKKKKAGVLEGIHLFVKHHYVKGIFAISCLFMVEVTIVDFTMKVLAQDHFKGLHPCTLGESCWNSEFPEQSGMNVEATAAFTAFMGFFGQATNGLSLLLSFFGTSAIIRYLGLRLTLLLFPTLCLIVIVVVRLNPTLYVVFGAMMILKANSYALNNPTKEMLYQPTSSAVRYKAKSWIDVFGARGSKAMGSLVNNTLFTGSAESLVANGSLVGMAVASFLIWNARFMGRLFDQYVEAGYVVGENSEDEDEDDGAENSANGRGNNIQMAEVQNEGESTSCAIYEDDEIGENISDNNVDEDESSEVELV